jgi:phosphoribosylaminoimidazole-succinocarboxamide synthase
MPALRSTEELGLTPDYTGKVRDVFDLQEHLLIVATDRISAFDVVMAEVVPDRGTVLTLMTLGWLRFFDDLPNHLITADPHEFPKPYCDHAERLGGRSMLVHKARRHDAECVVRGYLAGSGWKSYQAAGTVCGHRLSEGLQLASRLAEPLFTPSTKAEVGHDENIDFAELCRIVGDDTARQLRDLSLRLYEEAAAYTEPRGVILADTKFEFGLIDGRLAIIDEVLTPDSSRFWPAAEHRPGVDPPSFDKQILRNWLRENGWNGDPPPPGVPDEVLRQTSRRYREVLDILFAEEAARWGRYL